MEFYGQIKNRKIIPLFDSDEDQLRKLKSNKEYKFTVTSPRNYKFHKKFFALINLCFDNQEKYTCIEHLRGVLTMRAGFYETILTEKGTLYWPKSISFDKMDELEFESLYSKVLDQVCLMIGADKEDIVNELINFF